MTRRTRNRGPLVYVGKPLKDWVALCNSCVSAPRQTGDTYCASCRAIIDRANPAEQLSMPGLLPAIPAGDAMSVPGQLDLSDALNEGDTTHA